MQSLYVDWAAMIIKIRAGGHGNLSRVSRKLSIRRSTLRRWEHGSEPCHSTGERFKYWFKQEYRYIPYRKHLA